MSKGDLSLPLIDRVRWQGESSAAAGA